MSLTRRRSIAALMAALVVAACGAGATSPSPSPSPSPTPPVGYLLRVTATQAVPPVDRFGWLAHVAITADGVLVVQGAVPAIYPGPLLTPLFGRQLSQAGYRAIVTRAGSLGLLAGDGDFIPPDALPGGMLGRIEVMVDGTLRILVGDPSRIIVCIQAPCDPAPGSPEAFGAFWREVSDLSAWLGPELGPEGPFTPDGVALLVRPAVRGDSGLDARFAAWPLATSLVDLGEPIGGEALPRCATLRGADAATFLAAATRADQLTNWVPEGGDRADAAFIQVRPLLPGEDVCAELFGVGA